MRSHPIPCLAALTLAAAVPVGASAAPQATQTDFSGYWRFDPARSDDIRAKIEEVAGPAQMRGDSRFRIIARGGGADEVDRVELRAWMLELAGNPERELLEIEHSAREFVTGFGDNARRYYFSRKSTRQTETGEILKASIREGDEPGQLVIEEEGDDSHIWEVYTLLPDGQTLIVALRWENDRLEGAVDVRLVLERVDPEELD